METKQDIRKRIKNLRASLDRETALEKSRKIFSHVRRLPVYRQADEVYCYLDYNHEVCTREFLADCQADGKKAALPKVQDGKMDFYYFESFTRLRAGAYGILEPESKRRADGENVLVVLPCVAFDEDGNRLGYGGGYYDRYLAGHRQFHTVLVAFEIQKTERIPAEQYDIRPELLVTEKGVVTCRPYQKTR